MPVAVKLPDIVFELVGPQELTAVDAVQLGSVNLSSQSTVTVSRVNIDVTTVSLKGPGPCSTLVKAKSRTVQDEQTRVTSAG